MRSTKHHSVRCPCPTTEPCQAVRWRPELDHSKGASIQISIYLSFLFFLISLPLSLSTSEYSQAAGHFVSPSTKTSDPGAKIPATYRGARSQAKPFSCLVVLLSQEEARQLCQRRQERLEHPLRLLSLWFLIYIAWLSAIPVLAHDPLVRLRHCHDRLPSLQCLHQWFNKWIKPLNVKRLGIWKKENSSRLDFLLLGLAQSPPASIFQTCRGAWTAPDLRNDYFPQPKHVSTKGWKKTSYKCLHRQVALVHGDLFFYMDECIPDLDQLRQHWSKVNLAEGEMFEPKRGENPAVCIKNTCQNPELALWQASLEVFAGLGVSTSEALVDFSEPVRVKPANSPEMMVVAPERCVTSQHRCLFPTWGSSTLNLEEMKPALFAKAKALTLDILGPLGVSFPSRGLMSWARHGVLLCQPDRVDRSSWGHKQSLVMSDMNLHHPSKPDQACFCTQVQFLSFFSIAPTFYEFRITCQCFTYQSKKNMGGAAAHLASAHWEVQWRYCWICQCLYPASLHQERMRSSSGDWNCLIMRGDNCSDLWFEHCLWNATSKREQAKNEREGEGERERGGDVRTRCSGIMIEREVQYNTVHPWFSSKKPLNFIRATRNAG